MNKLHIKTFILFLLSTVTFSQTQGTRPNILLIVADDLGYADVGFNRDTSFPNELGAIHTPNLDELANDGIILKNAHVVHPFCGPSRVALLTGIYPHRIGAQYNLENDITSTLGVPENETYFSKILQDANYNTMAVGKWHLGYEEGKYQPMDRGFDEFFGFLGGGKNYFESVYEDSFYNRLGTSNPVTNEYQDPLQRNRDYVDRYEYSNAPNEDYLTDVLTDNAIQYISDNKNDTDPFFMYLAYNAPHTPLQAPQAEIDQFKLDNPNFEDLVRNSSYIINSTPVANISDPAEKAAKIEEFVEARVMYATMTVNMDKNIGRVMDELKTDMNVFNNTVIIFLSDNGGYRWSKGGVNYPLQQQKGSVLEGGHKVPMFVHWPDKITTSSTYNYQVSALDIYPTLSSLAGATIPASKKIDGLAFMDKIIAGEKVREDDKPLYAVRPQNGFHNGGLVSYPWKIVKTGNNGQWRLYNILNDPGESTDLRSSEANAEQIIDNLLDEAEILFTEFKDVVPAWYDNDGDGSGHPHSFLWDDGTLPGYDRLFERSFQEQEITVTGTTNAIEDGANGIFTVSLPNGTNASQDIDVTYTVSGNATEGIDYTTIARTVSIANGTNSSEITIDAVADGLEEGSETVTITLQSSSLENVSTTPASIHILDDNNPTILTAGDVAIVGYKAAAGNVAELAFVILKDINIGTSISFSNRGWKDDGSFNTGSGGTPYNIDDVYSWTTTESHTVGTIFKLNRNGKVTTVVSGVETEVGTTVQTFGSDGDWDLSPAGDSVLMYNGSTNQHPADNSSEWITGLNINGVDNGGSVQSAGWAIGGGNAYCELPAALVGFDIDVTGGDIALNLWDVNHGVYTGGATGSPATVRASINDYTNWSLDEANAYYLWNNDDSVSSNTGNINLGQVTLSLSDNNKANFNIYPNPTKDFFNLKLNENSTIQEVRIFSITGKLVKKIVLKELNTKIDIASLNRGVYIIKVKGENATSIKKLIKK